MRRYGAMLLFMPALAWAHAHLLNALPAAGSTVATAPAELVLNFSEFIEPNFSRIEVQDGAGASVTIGPAHAVPTEPAKLAVLLKPLAPGTYQVIWHVTSVDTHKTQGKFHFTVGK